MRNIKFFDSADYTKGLAFASSNSRANLNRHKVYGEVLQNAANLRENGRKLGLFDDTTSQDFNPSTMGMALEHISVKAMVNSIVGFTSVERSMQQFSQTFVYNDKITKTGAKVMPMIGKDNPRGRAEDVVKMELTAAPFSLDLAKPIVPGHTSIQFSVAGKTFTIVDDGKGNLLAPPASVSAATIDYLTGKIDITFTTEVTDSLVASDTISVKSVEERQDDNADKRIKARQGYFTINAAVNNYDFELNIISSDMIAKQGGEKLLDELTQSVYDEQVIDINGKVVQAIMAGARGNVETIDVSTFSIQAGRFDSLMKTFNLGIATIDSKLAAKTYKMVNATSYIVGRGLANLFMAMEDQYGWVPNKSGYVNDIVGFYKGRAVIRHLDVAEYEGYAIHKTEDGNLAPTAYGIYLPITNAPLVGNFQNVQEVAGGIYSVDGVSQLATDLIVKFKVEVPSDLLV